MIRIGTETGLELYAAITMREECDGRMTNLVESDEPLGMWNLELYSSRASSRWQGSLTIPSHRLRSSVSVAVEKVNGCARPGLDINKD